jgi:hypothetical protein
MCGRGFLLNRSPAMYRPIQRSKRSGCFIVAAGTAILMITLGGLWGCAFDFRAHRQVSEYGLLGMHAKPHRNDGLRVPTER